MIDRAAITVVTLGPMDKPCDLWPGRLSSGYGVVGADRQRRIIYAHRLAYEAVHGPIPPELEVDHLCHNAEPECGGGVTCPHRRCTEPTHLEAVSHGENVRRALRSRATCRRGHPWTEASTIRRPNGSRTCRICDRERRFRYYKPVNVRRMTPSEVAANASRARWGK